MKSRANILKRKFDVGSLERKRMLKIGFKLILELELSEIGVPEIVQKQVTSGMLNSALRAAIHSELFKRLKPHFQAKTLLTVDSKMDHDFSSFPDVHFGGEIFTPLQFAEHQLQELNVMADELEKLERKENSGRGIQCVKSIITYLRAGDKTSAVAVRQNEGDKTRSYSRVERYLIANLGCRLHGRLECHDDLCKSIEARA